MKKLITLLVLFISITAFAQDPYLQKNDEQAEKMAAELTEKYNEKLSLTAKQYLEFENKVTEFLIRRKKIESQFQGKEKLDYLYAMQKEETKEMADILTRIQHNVYKEIKPSIQPIARVEK